MKPTIKSFVLLFIFVFSTGAVKSQQPEDFVINVITSINEDPPSISFKWETIPGDSIITVCRKSKGDTDWGDPIAVLPSNAVEYSDYSVDIGVEYEYRILKETNIEAPYWVPDNFKNPEEWYEKYWIYYPRYKKVITYLSAGIKLPEVEYRGKVILLVDSSFVDSLRNELTLFESDLLGDGWKVLRKDISRNTSVKYVKSVIRDFYYSDTVLIKALILFGHIPIPYSGCCAFDGHAEELGAWQADMYYGSMNEDIWTDEYVNCYPTMPEKKAKNINIPGDGKFDLTVLPSDENIVLQIGRIDLSNMPSFPLSEAGLLRNYIHKNHDFRHKINNPKLQALVHDNFGWRNGEALVILAYRNFTALINSQNVKNGKYFTNGRTDSYLFSYANGGGDGLFLGNFINNVGNTQDFVRYNVKTVFTSFLSSVTGNWDYPDNFLRAALASNGWALTTFWGGWLYYSFYPMGMGESIGYCYRLTQNNINTYDYHADNRGIFQNLLGDPTLRMHIVCPVNSLQSAITSDNTIMLAWKPADDSIIGYHVYKLDTLLNEYKRIIGEPVTDTWFEDISPDQGNNYYMVKSYQLTQSASGSYYNLSQGVFDTINYRDQTAVPVTGIELSLAPDNQLPLLIYDPFAIDALVLPDSATNKLLKWSIENVTANGKLDVEGNILSDKGGTLIVKAEALDGSGIFANLEITIDSIPSMAGIITGDTAVCRNYETLLFTVPEIRGVDSYFWTFPNGITKTTTLNECTYAIDDNAASGLIRVKGHNAYADGEESTLQLTIYEKPETPEIEWIDNMLQSNVPDGNQWYKDGIAIEGATEQTYTPTDTASYFVKVTLNGCTSASSNRIKYPDVTLTEEILAAQIRIYPNPASDILNIDMGNMGKKGLRIEIISVTGEVIYSEKLSTFVSSTHTVDLSAFEAGIYLIRVSSAEYTITKKVIKVE